jgi:hypothetical protein
MRVKGVVQVGDIFDYCGREYILSRVSRCRVGLISLDTGEIFHNAVCVADPGNISGVEWGSISNKYNFIKVDF